MEQLLLELVAPEPPQFANFLPGPNAEALALLMSRLAQGSGESIIYLWGPPGAGKTHLLRAAVAANPGGTYLGPDDPWRDDPGVGLLAADDVDRFDARRQGALFSAINALRAAGGLVLLAGAVPPGQLRLREDVRSRLGWGLVFELKPLADEDKPRALAEYAKARGFAVPPEAIDYLLRHGRRDMGTLVRAMATLDRLSLQQKRPVSLALAKRLLRPEPS